MTKQSQKTLWAILLGGLFCVLSSPILALTATEAAKLLADDGATLDNFGYSVSIDGDTAVIGAQYDDDKGRDSGSAYVFVRTAGVWNKEAKLLAYDGAAYDWFGCSVSVDGDTAVIGAWKDDDRGLNSGSAYVFTRTAGVWTKQAKLKASDGAADDRFGYSVSVDGDTAVVGARRDDDKGANSGSTYVFTRTAGVWTKQAKLTASDGAPISHFGHSVSVESDTAVIGATGDSENGQYAGSVYVFVRTASVWLQEAKLIASDGTAGAHFGISVSVDGDTAVIGAWLDDDTALNSGSAYVFVRTANVWSQLAKLTASDGAADDRFGYSVSIDGNTALIGAYLDDDNGFYSGSAYVFMRAAGVWNEEAKLTASDAAEFDWFGNSVCVDGNTAVIGAYRNDDKGTDSGSAYIISLVSDDEGPVASNVAVTLNPVAINTSMNLTATIDDSTTGLSNITNAEYSIDSDTSVSMVAQDGIFDEVVEDVTAVIPAYADAGIHNVCVSGTDAPGNIGTQECVFLAVYDPDDGFVTGGGWIKSPAGSYVADPSLSGKANFGFVSKYQKGKSTPTGSTEFQFQTGDMNFYSDRYEWLVIAGPKALYKGIGTINGSGNYGFMLFAIDASLTKSTDADLFRIKIWDKDAGDAVVYDNEIGGADDTYPATEIGGGSIIIHTKDKK